MNKIIKWGLIGLGNASLNLAKEFNKIDNSKLIAIASKTNTKLEEFKKKFNISNENAYSDYEKIFKNKEIDIIFIGLPNTLHEKFCLKALEHNKHVLVEKPITINFESFLRIKNQFNKKNLLLEEGTANKHHPFYKNVIDILSKIKPSNIYKIRSSFGNDALGGKKIFGFRLKKININKRLFNKTLGGGAILDGAIYPISLIVDILTLFSKDYLEDFNIYESSKKISKNIDLNSKIYAKTKKIEIEIETSLIKDLSNNLEIYSKNEIIKIENIFNISSNSVIQIEKNGDTKIVTNIDKNNSYYHEIREISQLLIKNIDNDENFQKEFFKIEKNFELLSKWLFN
tara:strand:- start:2537 stop:3565 length:1029 start_codon:yes stop_codon:yes gene_type:complete